MLRKLVRRYGVNRTVFLLTLIAIILSLLITFAFNLVQGAGMPRESLVVALLAPAVISPILGYHNVKLLKSLDDAEQKLRLLAYTDELTETYNRRYFMQVLGQELARARREADSLAVIILDLDNFKSINDTYGHLAGDQVLRHLSSECKHWLRPGDVLARFGGDEFVILLPQTAKDDAWEFVQQLFARLIAVAVPVERETIWPRFSLGFTVLEPQDTAIDDVIRRADIALYQAKESGKNCIRAG